MSSLAVPDDRARPVAVTAAVALSALRSSAIHGRQLLGDDGWN
jgi:hypothetical protein